MADISAIEAHKRDHRKVQLSTEPRRLYHYGRLAAHLLGYVGEIRKKNWLRICFPTRCPAPRFGQSGRGKDLQQILFGQDGSRQVLVNSMGQEVGRLEEKDSVIGGEIQLTLDLIFSLLPKKPWRIKSERLLPWIRAAANSCDGKRPSFDPNDFRRTYPKKKWADLVNSSGPANAEPSYQNSYSPRFHYSTDHGGGRP